MPMRIISQGRHAYILAGYLMKRGKWSWQWSERYFVLTATALHYFKRDRRELYGKERGHLLVADMAVEFEPDKLVIDIRSRSTGQTRLLKAPTEREYLTWCRAFQDVIARQPGATAAGQALDGGLPRARNSGSAQREASVSQSQSFAHPHRAANSLLPPSSSMGAAGMQSATSATGRAAGHQSGSHAVGSAPHALQRPLSSPASSSGIGGAPHSSQSARGAHSAASVGNAGALQPSTAASRLASHLSAPGSAASSLQGASSLLSRAVSNPNSFDSANSSLLQLSPMPLTSDALGLHSSPDPSSTLSSGYATQPSTSPMGHHGHGHGASGSGDAAFDFASAGRSRSGSHTGSGGSMGTGSGAASGPHSHSHLDVLRRFSVCNDSSNPSSPRDGMDAGYPQHEHAKSGGVAHDPILMVTVEGGPLLAAGAGGAAKKAAPSSPGSAFSPPSQQLAARGAECTARLIAGTNVPWNCALSVPGFHPSSTLRATLGDGSQLLVPQSLMREEVLRGLTSGSKIVALGAAADSDSGASSDEYRSYQVLLNWRVSSAPLSAAERRALVADLALPVLFLIMLAACALCGKGPAHWMHGLALLCGAALSAQSLLNRRAAFYADQTARKSWEVTFVSLIEQPALSGGAAAAGAGLSTPSKPSRSGSTAASANDGGGSGATGSVSASSRKKKGILRRRANDLPSEAAVAALAAAGHPAPPPLRAHSTEGALQDFELSEYSDGATTSRESSQIGGGMRNRHRRPAAVHADNSGAAAAPATPSLLASSGDEPRDEFSGPAASAPAPHVASSLSPPVLGSLARASTGDAEAAAVAADNRARAISADSAISGDYQVVVPTDGSKAGARPDMMRAGSASTRGPSSGPSSHSGSRLGRAVSGRSDADSEAGDFGHTDAESHGLSDDEDEDEDGDEEGEEGGGGGGSGGAGRMDPVAVLELLNAYDDDPKPISSAHMPVPHPAPWGSWSEDDTSKLNVRGPNFLQDKVKIPVGAPIFKLRHVDMFYTAQSNDNLVHVTSRPGNWGFQYLARREQRWREMVAAGGKASQQPGSASPMPSPSPYPSPSPSPSSSSPHTDVSPLFVLNFLFPGPDNKNMNLVLYFVRRIRPGEELRRKKERAATGGGAGGAGSGGHDSHLTTAASSRRASSNAAGGGALFGSASVGSGSLELGGSGVGASVDIPRVCGFDRVLRQFLDGSDEFRDCRLKIIPRIADGPWLVRRGVGCVPAILGKKVKQLYYRDHAKNYLEIVADVSSSVIAGKILQLVKSAAASLTIDLSFVLQGEAPDELPESLLGGVRIYHCSLDGLLEIEAHEKWLQEVWLKKEIEAGRW